MNTFNLLISTPQDIVLEGAVISLKCKNAKGEFQIMKDHEPFISNIIPANLIVKDELGIEEIYFVGAGIIEVKNNKVILCVNSIVQGQNVDLERAEKSKARAEERLASDDKSIDKKRAKTSLERAIGRINLKNNTR
ncbi:MAG: ATP synthase F1 subunit epsilon [Sarcina sp.]